MINEKLLSNIRELCKKNNISVADLEKNLGIGAGTISRWNKANPSFDKITAIARYFNISIDELSGYRVKTGPGGNVGEETLQIIDYLKKKTVESDGAQNFWRDYRERNDNVELLVDELPGMNPDRNPDMVADLSQLYYACDEIENYLLEVFYCMDQYCDCETQIRLYLVPDEREKPVLECSDKQALQPLYVEIVNRMKMQKTQANAKKKRNELLKMIKESEE